MIDRRPLYITRPETSSLIAGGIDRLTAWLTRPWSHVHVERFCDRDLAHWRWTSSTPPLAMRSFRKMDDAFSMTIWSELVTGAYPGIDYEDWEDDDWREHPDVVPAEQWIGQVALETSSMPFEGAVLRSLLVTGDFTDEWEDGPDVLGADDVVCWLQPPRFQSCRVEDDVDPFTGRPPRSYWSCFGSHGLARLSRREIDSLGWTPLSAGIRKALEGRNGVERTWSRSFDVWFRISPAGRDERDWSAPFWFAGARSP